jgi:hypothetical protein
MRLLGGRRRKLLLWVAAFGLLLAMVAVFVLTPAGGREDSIRVSFRRFHTNAPGQLFASFSMTNAGKRTLAWMTLESEIKVNGQWVRCSEPIEQHAAFGPSGSGSMSVRVPPDGQAFRGKVEWLEDPTKFENLRLQFKAKAIGLFRGPRPDWNSWLNAYRHTNYSAEFSHPLPKSDGD